MSILEQQVTVFSRRTVWNHGVLIVALIRRLHLLIPNASKTSCYHTAQLVKVKQANQAMISSSEPGVPVPPTAYPS